jgi:phosphate starvation-inducible PhoH-like protein
VLKGVRGIAFTHFKSEDVVRHPLVQRIVNAYENYKLRLATAPDGSRDQKE